MKIRPRRESDVEALCELVQVVHSNDRYPVELQDNVRDFLLTTNCLGSWIADIDGRLVGHVGLHTVWSDKVAELALEQLGIARDQLGSVSRFFVASDVRGSGIGRALLAVATREARERHLRPILDVVTTYAPAIALYERAGWLRIGTVRLPMPNGEPHAEHVYIAPSVS